MLYEQVNYHPLREAVPPNGHEYVFRFINVTVFFVFIQDCTMLWADPMNAVQHVHVLTFPNAQAACNKQNVLAALTNAHPALVCNPELYDWMANEVVGYANLA